MKRLLLSSLLIPAFTDALSVNNVVLPSIDLNSLGSIGLVGEYDGISTYTYQGQQNTTADEVGDLLMAEVKGSLVPLEQLDGSIFQMCKIDDSVYFAGNFTKIGGNSAPNVASLNSTSGDIAALGSNGPSDGSISTVYCDNDNKLVYVGGNFTFNQTQGVAVWNTQKSEWQSPSFGGFKNSSSIDSISAGIDENTIVFGGTFSDLANSSFTSSRGSHNASFADIAQKQRISFNSATISAQGTADGTDPKSITCQNSKGWKLTDGRAGTWRADFPYSFTPTRMRLYNYNNGGDGTKHFQFLAFPLNGILNLTYTDPSTKQNVTCNSDCQLPESSTVPFLDFTFPNNVAMQSFQLDLQDFYGSAAGLAGIEIYSSDITTFAQESLNEPQQCEDAGSGGESSLSGSGWQSTTVEQQIYMTTTITDASQLSQTQVVFEPNVTVWGNYSINVWTPGCVADNTCATRGQVNATVVFSPKHDPVTTILYQTNQNLKFDQLYSGTVHPISKNFRPQVILTPIAPQSVPFTFVSQRAQFLWEGPTGHSKSLNKRDSSSGNSQNSDGEGASLNGLFEFNYDNFTKIDNSSYIPVGNTTINSVLSGASNINVNSVVKIGSQLLVGGKFTADAGQSFLVVESDKAVNVAGGGLNGVVSQIISSGDDAYIIGSFTGTADSKNKLQYAAIYSTSNNTWTSIGDRFNAPPDSVTAFLLNGTNTVTFTGPNGAFNIWVTGENKWLEESSLKNNYINGSLSSSLSIGNSTELYSGSLRTLDSVSPGGTFLSNSFGLTPMPFELQTMSLAANSSSNSTSVKRQVEIQQTLNGNSINVGVFANQSASIVGGHFLATANGSTFEHLLIINGQNVTGLTPNTLSQDSVIYSLLVDSENLYIGGDISTADNTVGGIAFYDMTQSNLSANQPPAINGGQAIVTTMLMQPDSTNLIVMGSFEQAGSLSCNAFCIYDTKQQRWNSPSGGITGTISTGVFITSDQMFFAGDMQLNGTQSYFAKYDFTTGAYTSYQTMSKQLPGPVNSFVLNGDGDQSSSIFASGLDSSSGISYLAHWNDKNWTRLDQNFQQGSVITELKLVELNQDHKSDAVLPSDQLLVVSGNLALKDFGNVSCVMFDGQNWQPLFLTSNGGSSGIVNSFFSQTDQVFGNILGPHHMAKGFVVLISLAIAVGLILLVVALGLFFGAWKKRSQGYRPAPSRVSEVDMTETVPPAFLFEEMGNVGGGRAQR